MQLTEQQHDALVELINIAFSRTAASLSELTDQRVLLDAPQVEVSPLADLNSRLAPQVPDNVATVHQPFAGPMDGDAFLVLSYSDAVILTKLLTDEPTIKTDRLDTSAREVLVEVGNILLNACLGMFGNLLQMHITFAVPRLHVEALHALLDSVLTKQPQQYALIVFTSFRLRDSEVSGYLVIVLGVASFEALLQAIETLG